MVALTSNTGEVIEELSYELFCKNNTMICASAGLSSKRGKTPLSLRLKVLGCRDELRAESRSPPNVMSKAVEATGEFHS